MKKAMILAAVAVVASAAFAEKPWLIVNEDNDHYFKNPSHLMTEEALLDEMGAKRGHRIALGVRICRDPDLAMSRMGMDVAKWAREGLVDLVVPHSFYWTDAGIAVAAWVERIHQANPNVRVVPGIEYIAVENDKEKWMTPAMYRYVADKFYREGAKGIYLFNLLYNGKYQTDGPHTPEDVAAVIFEEGLAPETIRDKEKTEVEVHHDFP